VEGPDFAWTLGPGEMVRKAGPMSGPLFVSTGSALQHANVIGLWSFLALDLNEGNGLTFLEGLETAADNGPEMDKQIAAFFALDKTVSLCFIEPLYGSVLLF
jgi:hypothetical protein